jgi:hypothetical protein
MRKETEGERRLWRVWRELADADGDPRLLAWFENALLRIESGEDPARALELGRRPGRRRRAEEYRERLRNAVAVERRKREGRGYLDAVLDVQEGTEGPDGTYRTSEGTIRGHCTECGARARLLLDAWGDGTPPDDPTAALPDELLELWADSVGEK